MGVLQNCQQEERCHKIGDRLLVGHGAQSWASRSGLLGQEASCLGKAMVQRHQAPLEFDEATVVVHQSPPKKCKEGEIGGWSWCRYAKTVACSYGFHWQDAHPVALA